MKFQLSALTRVKLQIIPIVLTAAFLLLNSTPGEAFWGKKVKEITDDELKEIKTELNLSKDSRFRSYSDSDLEDALNKEMDKDKIPGLTYGVYILNAINEQELVGLCSKSTWDANVNEEASRFFATLADDLASWQENLPTQVTKTTIEAVIKACGASGVSIGISSLFLALDLAKIQVSIIKLDELLYSRALWHYIVSRKLGDPHESAWGSAPIPIEYRNKQTEDYFKSLWGRYGKHMSEDGLAKDFKQQQGESLKVFLLSALGAQNPPMPTSPWEIVISPFVWIREWLQELSEKSQILLEAQTVVQASQEKLAGELAGFAYAINQNVANLNKEIENVKESYTLKEEFTEELSKFQGELEKASENVEEISAKVTTLQTNQEKLNETTKSITQSITSLYDVIENVKESYTLKEEFTEELSKFQGELEKAIQRLELLEKPIAELTILKVQIERETKKIDQEILIMGNYRGRIDEMNSKIHELATLVARHERQIKTNKLITWLLILGVVFATTAQM